MTLLNAVTIKAGNIAHIDRTFTRVDPTVSVVGSTAAAAVTDAAGTTTALTEIVTIDPTAGTVRVVADWTIPDNYPQQFVTVTIDVGTAMVAAWEGTIYVQARTLAVVP